MSVKCEICGREFSGYKWYFPKHLKEHNLTTKEYYDRYLCFAKPVCSICGAETKFLSLDRGYAELCHKCSWSEGVKKAKTTKASWSDEKKLSIRKKAEATTLERYGVTNMFQIKEVHDRAISPEARKKASEKNRKTCREKYGVDNVFQLESSKEKAKNTKVIRYGSETFSNRDKARKTKEERYGDAGYTNRKKATKTFQERYGADNYLQVINANHAAIEHQNEKIEEFERENDCTLVAKLVKQFGQGWYKAHIVEPIVESSQRTYIRNCDIPIIEKYAMDNHVSSINELEVLDFVKNILGDVGVETNTRKIISPYELDIYIPEKKLAIEYNGVYYHCDDVKDKDYHITKTELCDKLGIRLIHIFESEWHEHKDICKSLIKSALGLYDKRVYARDCKVKLVSSTDATNFLSANHLQGAINSTYRLGLYYDEELVQLITIGKSRFKDGEIELLRMCSKVGWQIVGGFSKLMNHQPYNEMISYVDRGKFSGTGYFSGGWEFISYTPISYFYSNGKTTMSRYQAQKHKLPNILKVFDSKLTEVENMKNNHWFRIYDCGNLKVLYKRVTKR